MVPPPTFSQRLGLTPMEPPFQLNGITKELHNRLWSLAHQYCFANASFSRYSLHKSHESSRYNVLITIWDAYFKSPIDTIPKDYSSAVAMVREWFLSTAWNNVYDLIEIIGTQLTRQERPQFLLRANQILEAENSAYRFIDGLISPITDKNEIDSIMDAMSKTQSWQPVSHHLKTALSLLSDKTAPDFRNSIKESISAVESAARLLTGDPKPTLGDAVKLLEKNGKLHPALAKALSSLYGYTNDADGIRHSLLEEPNLTYLEAKFMLVACSAFCNHLRGKAT